MYRSFCIFVLLAVNILSLMFIAEAMPEASKLAKGASTQDCKSRIFRYYCKGCKRFKDLIFNGCQSGTRKFCAVRNVCKFNNRCHCELCDCCYKWNLINWASQNKTYLVSAENIPIFIQRYKGFQECNSFYSILVERWIALLDVCRVRALASQAKGHGISHVCLHYAFEWLIRNTSLWFRKFKRDFMQILMFWIQDEVPAWLGNHFQKPDKFFG